MYIETTIPSAYFDIRRDPAMVARRDATRRWWATAGERYELVTSALVREELEQGPVPMRSRWLELIEYVPLLKRSRRTGEIASVYITHKLMPAEPSGDAVHLALASTHSCSYLLTWDRKHLANPNKARHIQHLNEALELFVPRILTPLELLEEETDAG